MASISSIGMSGLPLEDLLNNLRKNENSALALIEDRKTVTEAKITAYAKLQASVSALQASAAVVAGQSNAFGAMKATTASDAFSATPSNKAIPGQYNIQIDSLASAQTLVANGQADRTTAIGTGGSIEITLANGKTHTLDMTGKDTSLNGLLSAINDDPDIGVSATLVNDGSGTPHRLLLTARETGTEAAVAKIEVTGNTELQNIIGFDKGVGGDITKFSEQAASNAKLFINSVEINSQTNAIKDAVDGIELTLTKVTTEPNTLTITRNNEAGTKAVNDFVTAYNSLQDTIKGLTQYDVDNQKSSALTGDALARRVQSEMRSALNSTVGTGTLRTLSEIGVTTDPKTGKLSVDNAKLSTALTNNPEDVAGLFTGASGVGKLVDAAAESLTRGGGLFSNANDGLDRTLAAITKQYNATADRIDQRMETYRKQFVQLDVMVVQMNSISSYLTQQLSMLGNSNSKS